MHRGKCDGVVGRFFLSNCRIKIKIDLRFTTRCSNLILKKHITFAFRSCQPFTYDTINNDNYNMGFHLCAYEQKLRFQYR